MRARRVPSVRALQKKLEAHRSSSRHAFICRSAPFAIPGQGAHRPDKAAQILLRIIARDLAQWCALSKARFFLNIIGRTDNQHSDASGVAFAYAGTSLCGTDCSVAWSFISVHRLLWLPVTVLTELWQLFLAVIPLQSLA